MAEIPFSEYEKLLIQGGNPAGTSMFLVLAWIAVSDEHLDEREGNELLKVVEQAGGGRDIRPLLALAQKPDLNAIQLAIEILSTSFVSDKAELMLRLIIRVALADGYLRPSENYIIRLLVDAFQISGSRLNEIFKELTNKPFPDPPDLSASSTWETSGKNKREANPNREGTLSERFRALAILGLDEEATSEDIQKAYKRMALVHHPDKFASLGEEAMSAATVSFRRIKEAYDHLMTNA